MTLDRDAIARILGAARARGAAGLLEAEGMAVLAAMGVTVPRHEVVADVAAAMRLPWPVVPGERVAIKVVAPHIVHKTDVHGVVIVPNHKDDAIAMLRTMTERFADQAVSGFMLQAHVPHERAFGHEWLVGLRWTRAFGPVVTVGPGGVATEALACAFRPGSAFASLSPSLSDDDAVARVLGALAPARLVTGPRRSQPAQADLDSLVRVVRAFFELGREFMPDPIAEFEVNPLVLSGGRFVALDALLRFAPSAPMTPAPRPLAKIRYLLEPRSMAVMGVSERMNPGRIILRNILRDGTPSERITVIKPGCDVIDGCRCVPSLEALPGRVDLLILSISAAQAPDALGAVIAGQRAEGVILIPGGLDEHPEGRARVAAMREELDRSRRTTWGGPVVNGGNCLGIRSVPGRYNTLFIPEHKLPLPSGVTSPVALISGSGAFAVSKLSKLTRLNPRYVLSIGNQMDLTVGDYLEVLKADPAVDLFAIYLEGFQPLDGLRFLEAAAEVTAMGRTVVLYAAGRSAAGAAAAASHTAAVASDYEVLCRLAAQAGIVVAESLLDFEDLVRLFAMFHNRSVLGAGLGAVSNAGYECVAIADHLGAFRLATFVPETMARLEAVVERARLGGIVSLRNPIDLTPIMADADYEAIAHHVLEDPDVGVGIVGCVPLTGALRTLPPGAADEDDVTREDSLVNRLVRLNGRSAKPWVAVVDGGGLYDLMAERLEAGGVPTFRTADRAMRLLNLWFNERSKRAQAGKPRDASSPPAEGSALPV